MLSNNTFLMIFFAVFDPSPLTQISSKSVEWFWGMVIKRFLKMAAVCHLGFVGCVFGPPILTTWWFLSLCRISLKSKQ